MICENYLCINCEKNICMLKEISISREGFCSNFILKKEHCFSDILNEYADNTNNTFKEKYKEFFPNITKDF